MVTKAYLKEVRQRCEAATRGPWVSIVEGRDQECADSVIIRGPLDDREEDLYIHGGTIADQDFIAHARQDITILLDEIERLSQLLNEKQ